MTDGFSIAPALSAKDLQSVRELFRSYAGSLAIDLGYQGFSDEVANLPGRYAAPGGCLLLASSIVGAPVGCVGLRLLECSGYCEMKRLYVLPSTRGSGLGRSLTLQAMNEAAHLGYRRMRLDTLNTMHAAIALYEQLGFERILAYYHPVPPGTVFMEFDMLAGQYRRAGTKTWNP